MAGLASDARHHLDDRRGAALGRRIAHYRCRRGYSQRDLAALVGRSESWVSQVERGVRGVDRMTVLRAVADALHAPLGELLAGTPLTGAVHDRSETARELRLLLSAGAAPWLVPTGPVDRGPLAARLAEAAELALRARYDALPALLVGLLTDVEQAARAAPAGERQRCHALSAGTYLVAATALRELGEATTAWVAADRAAHAAERSGDHLRAVACAVHLVRALAGDDRLDQAEHTARGAIRALGPLPTARARSAAAALWVELAVVAARGQESRAAEVALERARVELSHAGGPAPDWPVDLTRVDVVLAEVAVAVELGDAATALRRSVALAAEELDPARALRLKLDVARAHLRRGDNAGVLRAVLEAERLSPPYVRAHPRVHSAVRHLLRTAASPGPGLCGLAERCGLPGPAAGPRLHSA